MLDRTFKLIVMSSQPRRPQAHELLEVVLVKQDLVVVDAEEVADST